MTSGSPIGIPSIGRKSDGLCNLWRGIEVSLRISRRSSSLSISPWFSTSAREHHQAHWQMSLESTCFPQNFRYQSRSGLPEKGIIIEENLRRRKTLNSNPSQRLLEFVRFIINHPSPFEAGRSTSSSCL